MMTFTEALRHQHMIANDAYSHLAGTTLIDIETFYRVRYLFGLHFELDTNYVRRLERQHALDCNDVWYELGLYDKYERDYFGTAFVLKDDDEDYEYNVWRVEQSSIQDAKMQERLGF